MFFIAISGAIAATDYNSYKTNTSKVMEIVYAQANCDLLTWDNGFEEEFDKYISSEKPLQANYETFFNQMLSNTKTSKIF